jgi:hypothetical protein
MTYYLVLTIMLGGSPIEFVSMAEFSSEEACHERAEQMARLRVSTPWRVSCRAEQRA